MYVVISRNHNTRVHFFTDNGWSWSVPSHFRAIEWRHHLDASGECQPDSVASLMRTNTCFLLGYSQIVIGLFIGLWVSLIWDFGKSGDA